MKSLIQALVVAAFIAAPAAAFAQQSNAPVTREQVKAELIQLEKAGYRPGLASPYYPDNIQAAQARIAAQTTAAEESGGVAGGSSDSGYLYIPVDDSVKPLYFGR
jgi:hypothetical protein